MSRFLLILCALFPGLGATAQTLTPEEILAMVDEKVSAQNPYGALLNDPDPARSLAAMEIMLASGDPTLARLATEFGLLSPNPVVTRAAVKGILDTGPNLTLRLESANGGAENYKSTLENNLGGTMDGAGVGYAQIPVGDWNETASCYVWRGYQNCVVRLSAEGYFVSGYNKDHMRGLMTVDGEGRLAGVMRLHRVDEPVPATIRLME